MDEREYRIEYVIQRREKDDPADEFHEIGFGSSGGWRDINTAAHMVISAIQNREWETEPSMPEPSEVDHA